MLNVIVRTQELCKGIWCTLFFTFCSNRRINHFLLSQFKNVNKWIMKEFMHGEDNNNNKKWKHKFISKHIIYIHVYPVNRPDPIRKRFGYGQLWPLWSVCTQYRAGLYPASVSAPFFQRRHGSYCAKQTRFRSGWPGQGLAKRIWSGSKPVCRNHLARFLEGHNQSTTGFPLSDSVPFFHRHPGWYCAKPAWIRFSSGWLCQFLAERIWSGSKPVCKNHLACFWPVLCSQSGPDANRIRYVYWVC